MNYYILGPVAKAGFGQVVASYPFVVPGLHCPACQDTWAGYAPIPVACPIEFRKRLMQKRAGPMELDEHRDLVFDLTSSLGLDFREIRPGNCLMPSLSRRLEQTDDFIWTFLPTTIFVSDRVKRAFESHAFRGVSFFKPFFFDTDNERAELEERLSANEQLESSSPLWEMTFPYILNSPDLKAEHFKCAECRRGGLEKIPKELMASLVGRFDMIRVKWVNEVVVSERVKDLIEKERFTNTQFLRRFSP